jgi:glycosyltransferase involved in cell wall biosynthesis
MDINDFLVDKYEHEQYDYKILVYGNYTYRDNLEADSLVEVLRRVIPYLTKRWKIHFTILIPEFVKSLDFPNVEQKIYTLPTYVKQMRTHFDSIEFMKHFGWKTNDWDIIYTHLPEHTNQIANSVYNYSNITPKIIGYSHWFELPENAPYPKHMLDASVAGLLNMDECGVNSNWLKQLTIHHAKTNYNDSVIKKLENIIQPHYLGVDRINARKVSEYDDKTVIFNHRDAGYTGWKWFVKVVDEIWETRQDFKVYTTLAQIDRPWNKRVKLTGRDEYMDFLAKIKFGVGTFQTYSAWSISTTDGLSVGCPYLLPNNLCYPEMVSVASTPYPYLYDGKADFIKRFNEMLDNPIEYDTTELAKNMLWDETISKWFGGWDKVFDLKPIGDTESLQKIKDFIKDKLFASKKDILEYFNWGVRIVWTNYRNALRNDDNIKLTKNGYEWVGPRNIETSKQETK